MIYYTLKMGEKMDKQCIEKILAEGRLDGVDVELLYQTGQSSQITVFEGKVDSKKYSDASCLGVRVVTPEGREGCAYTERQDESALLQAYKEAKENASICMSVEPVQLVRGKEVENWISFFNPALESTSFEQLESIGLTLESKARKMDKRIVNVPYTIVSFASDSEQIENTCGVSVSDRHNGCGVYLGVTAEENGIKKTASAYWRGYDFASLNIDEVVHEAMEESIGLLNAKPLKKNGNYCVVLRQEIAGTLLSCFASLFSAKSVLEGRSILKGKIGKSVAHQGITLIDCAQMLNGSGHNFDSEGAYAQSITLLEKGVLKNFLHNSMTARTMNVENNGRASRSPKGSLGIASTNWILTHENQVSRETLFSFAPDVIEVVDLQGLHAGVNEISGDFSLQADGYLYQNGQKQTALDSFTIAGNIIDLLCGIQAVGDDIKMGSSDVQTGSICVEKIAVSGS